MLGGLQGGSPALEDVGRRVAVQAAVLMFVVVPAEEVVAPATCMGGVGEAPGVVGLGLEGLEVRFRVGIVVAHPRSGVTDADLQFGEQVDEARRGHRRAAVLMHGEAGSRRVSRYTAADEATGERAALGAGDHPADDISAVQVDQDIQEQAQAAIDQRQFGDVPGPHLVGRDGLQTRDRVYLRWADGAPFVSLAGLLEQSLHRADRADEGALGEQRVVGMRRRLIAEARAVQEVEDFCPLNFRQSAMRGLADRCLRL